MRHGLSPPSRRMPSTRPGYGSGARPLREAGAVRCHFSRSDCRLLNLLLPRARGEGGRFGAAPHLFAPLRVARRVRRAPLRAGRRLLREVLGHFGSASPPFFAASSACVPGWFWHLGNTLPRSTVQYGCISMQRYWSSLRYSFLRTLFLLADRLRRRPTPARPFPSFFCLCWCGLSRAGFLSFPLFSLRVSISRSTGILGIPFPVLLSNTSLVNDRV